MRSTSRLILFALLAACLHISPAAATDKPYTTSPGLSEIQQGLTWHDDEDHAIYEQNKNRLTKIFLEKIDAFVSRNISTGASVDEIKNNLDFLGYKKGVSVQSLVFRTDLPAGHFLILGIEIQRGGETVPENAISLRAYKETNDHFTLTAEANDLASSDAATPYLNRLYGAPLKAPKEGEFWLLAWAGIPPHVPPEVAMKLYRFDGAAFHTVWSPQDVITADIEAPIRLTPNGFTLKRLQTSKSPTIIDEEYILRPDGPEITGAVGIERN